MSEQEKAEKRREMEIEAAVRMQQEREAAAIAAAEAARKHVRIFPSLSCLSVTQCYRPIAHWLTTEYARWLRTQAGCLVILATGLTM